MTVRPTLAIATVGLLLALVACGADGGDGGDADGTGTNTSVVAPTSTTSTTLGTVPSTSGPTTTASTAPSATGGAAGDASPAADATRPTGAVPRGTVVVLDAGHNGGNGTAPTAINRQVDIGTGTKACDTTGTATDSGTSESSINFELTERVRAGLEAAGITVVLTRADDEGVGPCIDERAAIGNRAGAAAAVSIHADGGPPTGRGFHVIRPALVAGRNDAVVGPSADLAVALRDALAAGSGLPTSTYLGDDGIDVRGDLGGLNLSTVPKVFIECGNLRNATDAALLTDPTGQARVADAIVVGVLAFLAG